MPEVVYLPFQHRDSFQTHTESEAAVLLRVYAGSFQNVGIHHPASQNLQPAGALADVASLAMADIAAVFGQRAVVQDGNIDIIGNGHPNYPNNPINCHNDPWVFMSMVLASTVASDSYVLDNERGAEKIYRNFLSEFKQLGGMYMIM